MSKPEVTAQLTAIADKMDAVSSALAESSYPTEEVDALCDTLIEAQTILENVKSTIAQHNCACTKEWKAENTVIAEKVG